MDEQYRIDDEAALAVAIEGGAGSEELIAAELEKSYREELY